MENYDVDYTNGFFPPEPLPRLSGQFELWEDALDDAEGNLSLGEDTRANAKAKRPYGENWRERVRNVSMVTANPYWTTDAHLLHKFPLLDTDHLAGELRLMQRAHMVLAFLIHFYVHSQPPSGSPTPIHVPECLAVPIVNVSRMLGIAPVLTFADTVLWNVKPADPQLPLSANNIVLRHTFSCTDTEKNLHHRGLCAIARLYGPPCCNQDSKGPQATGDGSARFDRNPSEYEGLRRSVQSLLGRQAMVSWKRLRYPQMDIRWRPRVRYLGPCWAVSWPEHRHARHRCFPGR